MLEVKESAAEVRLGAEARRYLELVFELRWLERLLELVHGVQHLLVVRAIVFVDFLGRNQVGQVPVILLHSH